MILLSIHPIAMKNRRRNLRRRVLNPSVPYFECWQREIRVGRQQCVRPRQHLSVEVKRTRTIGFERLERKRAAAAAVQADARSGLRWFRSQRLSRLESGEQQQTANQRPDRQPHSCHQPNNRKLPSLLVDREPSGLCTAARSSPGSPGPLPLNDRTASQSPPASQLSGSTNPSSSPASCQLPNCKPPSERHTGAALLGIPSPAAISGTAIRAALPLALDSSSSPSGRLSPQGCHPHRQVNPALDAKRQQRAVGRERPIPRRAVRDARPAEHRNPPIRQCQLGQRAAPGIDRHRPDPVVTHRYPVRTAHTRRRPAPQFLARCPPPAPADCSPAAPASAPRRLTRPRRPSGRDPSPVAARRAPSPDRAPLASSHPSSPAAMRAPPQLICRAPWPLRHPSLEHGVRPRAARASHPGRPPRPTRASTRCRGIQPPAIAAARRRAARTRSQSPPASPGQASSPPAAAPTAAPSASPVAARTVARIWRSVALVGAAWTASAPPGQARPLYHAETARLALLGWACPHSRRTAQVGGRPVARIAIIGLGYIGGSIGLGLRKASLKNTEIVGFDDWRRARNAADKQKAVDQTAGSLREAVDGAGLVILATPPAATEEILREVAPHLGRGAAVTDTAASKVQVHRWASEQLPSGVSFVGGHPMAGDATTFGVENASATLFQGKRWFVSPSPTASDAAVKSVLGMIRELGALPHFLSDEEHDYVVAAASHLPLVVSTALFTLLRSSDGWPDFGRGTADTFRKMTAFNSGDPSLTTEIAITNREQLQHWIDRFVLELHPGPQSPRRARRRDLPRILHRPDQLRQVPLRRGHGPRPGASPGHPRRHLADGRPARQPAPLRPRPRHDQALRRARKSTTPRTLRTLLAAVPTSMAATNEIRRITPAGPLRGELRVPGDKSISHRALICNALAAGEARVSNLLDSADCRSTIACLKQWGVTFEQADGDLIVRSPGQHAFHPAPRILDCGNSGTSIRLLAGVAAGLPFASEFDGDQYLRRRPMARILEPLASMGARVSGTEAATRAPFTVDGANGLSSGFQGELAVASAASQELHHSRRPARRAAQPDRRTGTNPRPHRTNADRNGRPDRGQRRGSHSPPRRRPQAARRGSPRRYQRSGLLDHRRSDRPRLRTLPAQRRRQSAPEPASSMSSATWAPGSNSPTPETSPASRSPTSPSRPQPCTGPSSTATSSCAPSTSCPPSP